MISVDGLAKQYGDVSAVRGVDLDIREGEVFGLVGPNGAGKTSTLKMLAGLVDPTAGSATVNGYDAQDPEMRRSLGFLPEESPLYEDMTPRGYLRFFADLYDVDRDTANDRIERALDRLDADGDEQLDAGTETGLAHPTDWLEPPSERSSSDEKSATTTESATNRRDEMSPSLYSSSAAVWRASRLSIRPARRFTSARITAVRSSSVVALA